MSLRVKRFLPLLEYLKEAPPAIRSLILEKCERDLIVTICEICLNFCEGNINCSKKSYNKLKKFRKSIHKLASLKNKLKNSSNSSNSKSKKLKVERKILTQKGSGGFLPILLAPVISGLSQYIFEKLQK